MTDEGGRSVVSRVASTYGVPSTSRGQAGRRGKARQGEARHY